MPRQLANRPRAHPSPSGLSRPHHAEGAEYPVLPTVSRGCPGARGRLPTCYSAVRHSIRPPEGALSVRLACVRRAASVHPEPGSNSPFRRRGPGPRASIRASGRGVPDSDLADLDSFGNRRPGSRPESEISLVCLVDLSIAVSGFQGSPRGATPSREESIYATAGRARAAPGVLHGTSTFLF